MPRVWQVSGVFLQTDDELIAAAVSVKSGLRNPPEVHPAGTHLEATTLALSREPVPRPGRGLELLARSGYKRSSSHLGALGLAVLVLTAA